MELFLKKITERKVFSSDLQTTMEFCAQTINSLKTFFIDDFDIDTGTIICIFCLSDKGRKNISKDNGYYFSLVFNTIGNEVECVGTVIKNELVSGNIFAKLIARKMLRKLFNSI